MGWSAALGFWKKAAAPACSACCLPAPHHQEELRAAFNPSNGWSIATIERDRIETRYHDDGALAGSLPKAWLKEYGWWKRFLAT